MLLLYLKMVASLIFWVREAFYTSFVRQITAWHPITGGCSPFELGLPPESEEDLECSEPQITTVFLSKEHYIGFCEPHKSQCGVGARLSD